MTIKVNKINTWSSKQAGGRKQLTFLKWALLTGATFCLACCLLRLAFAVSWPQSAFQNWQTAYNPIETLLEPLPDLFWWTGDVAVTAGPVTRGRAWSPIVVDYGVQGAPDPVVVVGRQNQL